MARDREDREERGFRYQRRSVDDARKRASEKTGSFDSFIKSDFKRYKPRDGKNLIRILPPTWKDPKHYAYTIFLNYSIGADNQTFLSLSEMKSEKDPLAEAKKEAQRDGDKDLAKALTPRKRSLMWIVDRLDEEEGPQLWDAPFTVDTDFVNLSIDEDTKEVIWVDDPAEGCDIRFYKEGSGLATKYPAARMKILSASPLSEDKGVQREWLDFIHENPVPDCLEYFDYDHIADAFDGVIGSRDDDEAKNSKNGKGGRDEDELPPRKTAARHDDDEGSEPDPKPARRPRQQLDEDDEGGDQEPRGNKSADDDESDAGSDEDAGASKPRPSIRERLAQRRSKRPDDDD